MKYIEVQFITNSKEDYKVGDIISFRMDYGATLASMTSSYVDKEYV